MLTTARDLYPTITVSNMELAKQFYKDKLGLTIAEEIAGGVLFEAGGHKLFIYQKDKPEVVEHTLAGFLVEDLEKEVDELTQKGVVFEHYDFPGLKTDEKGIATTAPVKAAWFKDPDGNVLGITQRM